VVGLTEEKKQFVLYEYLLYFWRKKWFFLIVPLITTIIVASAIYMLKVDKKYTGQMIVFTGSINLQDLTNDNNILSNFKDLNADLDIFVSEKGQVKFTIKGDSKDDVRQKLSHIEEVYIKDLKSQSDAQLKKSTDEQKEYEDKVDTLNDALDIYEDKLEEDLSDAKHENISLIIIETLEELSHAETRVNKIKGDLLFFEKPEVLFQTVHPTKTYLKESIAIGLILGVLLTVALLMLLKYLGVARRNYNHD
jgi:hypothetical protein